MVKASRVTVTKEIFLTFQHAFEFLQLISLHNARSSWEKDEFPTVEIEVTNYFMIFLYKITSL